MVEQTVAFASNGTEEEGSGGFGVGIIGIISVELDSWGIDETVLINDGCHTPASLGDGEEEGKSLMTLLVLLLWSPNLIVSGASSIGLVSSLKIYGISWNANSNLFINRVCVYVFTCEPVDEYHEHSEVIHLLYFHKLEIYPTPSNLQTTATFEEVERY